MKTIKTKICNKCNIEKGISDFYYHRIRKYYMESCKECNKQKSILYQKRKIKEDNAKYILTQRAGSIRRDRKKYNIPVADNLSKILYEQWILKEGKCYYTNEPMSLQGYKNNHFAATVDRIKPELGYVEGNVVLCCAIINKIKTNLQLNELFDWIEKIKNNINT